MNLYYVGTWSHRRLKGAWITSITIPRGSSVVMYSAVLPSPMLVIQAPGYTFIARTTTRGAGVLKMDK